MTYISEKNKQKLQAHIELYQHRAQNLQKRMKNLKQLIYDNNKRLEKAQQEWNKMKNI